MNITDLINIIGLIGTGSDIGPIFRGILVLIAIITPLILYIFKSRAREYILTLLIIYISLPLSVRFIIGVVDVKHYAPIIYYVPAFISLIILIALYLYKVRSLFFYVSLFFCVPVIYLSILISNHYHHVVCYKEGGVLVHRPLSSHRHDGNTICHLEYKDGGKACKNNADCMGDCIKVSNIVEHGKCSPATLYNGGYIYYESMDDPYESEQKCPHDEVNGSCKLELFNKSDKWKDFHYVM